MVATGNFAVAMLRDCRCDVAGGRDYSHDLFGPWLQESFGDVRKIAYEGYSRAGRGEGRFHFCLPLTMRPVASRSCGHQTLGASAGAAHGR